MTHGSLNVILRHHTLRRQMTGMQADEYQFLTRSPYESKHN